MWALRLQGQSYDQIGKLAGVSRQRVEQVLSPPPAIREAVLERAGRACEGCGLTLPKGLQIHHRAAEGLAPDTYEQPENLVALCVSCHMKAHGYGTDHMVPPPRPRVSTTADNPMPQFGECPIHHRPLMCPACVGARGRGRTSEKKAKTSRENMAKAHQTRAEQRKETRS